MLNKQSSENASKDSIEWPRSASESVRLSGQSRSFMPSHVGLFVVFAAWDSTQPVTMFRAGEEVFPNLVVVDCLEWMFGPHGKSCSSQGTHFCPGQVRIVGVHYM